MADNDNLKYWEQMKDPPANACKKIRGGRLANKTDINPQWRLEKMTEIFGPVGVGWTYRIVRTWTEQGRIVPKGPNETTEQREVVSCAEIALKYRYAAPKGQGDADGFRWSEEIPGLGGHMLVVRESSGFHTNDECYKMAITDALSVALKQLGMGATVYRGQHDSKYDKDGDGDRGSQQELQPPAGGGGAKRFRNR